MRLKKKLRIVECMVKFLVRVSLTSVEFVDRPRVMLVAIDEEPADRHLSAIPGMLDLLLLRVLQPAQPLHSDDAVASPACVAT